MKATWTKTHSLLLICSLVLLAGCLQEDAVTITKDGRVSFESVVTEPDEKKQIEFPAFEKLIAQTLDGLRQRKWKADVTWTSKQRPYQLKITGSGKLPEVVGSTGFYTLAKIDDTTYKVSFLAPENSLRIAFQSPENSATISDAAGKPVHEIENVSSAESFTISLK